MTSRLAPESARAATGAAMATLVTAASTAQTLSRRMVPILIACRPPDHPRLKLARRRSRLPAASVCQAVPPVICVTNRRRYLAQRSQPGLIEDRDVTLLDRHRAQGDQPAEGAVDVLPAGADHRCQLALGDLDTDPPAVRDRGAVPVGEFQQLAGGPARHVKKGDVGQLLVLPSHVPDHSGEQTQAKLRVRSQGGLEVVLAQNDAARGFDGDGVRGADPSGVELAKLAEVVSSWRR